jgi:hypothetical protein
MIVHYVKQKELIVHSLAVVMMNLHVLQVTNVNLLAGNVMAGQIAQTAQMKLIVALHHLVKNKVYGIVAMANVYITAGFVMLGLTAQMAQMKKIALLHHVRIKVM